MEQSSLATKDIDVPITAPAGVDVTTLPVQVAFVTRGKPAAGDWHNAAWAVSDDGKNVARILVGPAGGVLTLATGTWYEWFKVSGNPETVVDCAGSVTIT